MRFLPVKTARTSLILCITCIFSLIAGCGLAIWLNREIASGATRMTVEAFIPSGGRFAFYATNRPIPEVLPIAPNQWHAYVFKVPSHLSVMRLDPTELPVTGTQIRAIRFTRGAAVLRNFDLSTLPSWGKYNTAISYDAGTGIATFNATGSDQFAMSAVDVNLGAPSRLQDFELDRVSLLWACVAGVCLYFLLQTWEAGWQTAAACVILTPLAFYAARAALWAVPLLHLQPASPGDAVGNPTFTGVSKSAEIVTVAAGIGFAMGVVWIVMLAWRRLAREPLTLSPARVAMVRLDLGFLGAVFVTFAIASLPELQGICLSVFNVHHPFAFDPQIQVLWQNMAHRGLLPDRDYWYPYTGLYNKFAPLYPEVLLNYFHNLAVFSIMAASTYILFGKRKIATAIVLLPLLPLLEAAGVVWPDASWRYLLCASVAVSLAAALATGRVVWFGVWGAWSAYVLSQESAQLVYAVPACLFLAVAVLGLERERLARFQTLRLMACGAGVFVVLSGAWFTMMISEGRAAEWWGYMSGLDTQSHYFAFPFDAGNWFHQPFSVETFGYVVLMLLFVLGSLQVLRTRGPLQVSYLAPLALALATGMMFQKEVLRPGIMTQLMAVPLYGLVVILVQYRPAGNDREPLALAQSLRLGWGSFACAFFAVLFLFLPGKLTDVDNRYMYRLKSWKENLSYALDHKPQWAAAAAYYFSPEAITMEDAPGNVVKAEFLRATGARTGVPGQIFALGDCAYWYLLLDQQPPFYFMFFHQAPLDAQQNTLRWLQSRQPRYVIWEPGQQSTDAVPNQVRVPLLYTYIAANYVPSTQVRNFQVLRRRAPGEPADLAFWVRTLTPKVDLGYIPALSRIGAGSVFGAGSFPVSYALVHVPSPVTGQAHQIPIQVGTAAITVSFQERAPVTDYPIRLDRIALVAAAAANGIQPRIDPAVTIHSGFLRRDLLY